MSEQIRVDLEGNTGSFTAAVDTAINKAKRKIGELETAAQKSADKMAAAFKVGGGPVVSAQMEAQLKKMDAAVAQIGKSDAAAKVAAGKFSQYATDASNATSKTVNVFGKLQQGINDTVGKFTGLIASTTAVIAAFYGIYKAASAIAESRIKTAQTRRESRADVAALTGMSAAGDRDAQLVEYAKLMGLVKDGSLVGGARERLSVLRYGSGEGWAGFQVRAMRNAGALKDADIDKTVADLEKALAVRALQTRALQTVGGNLVGALTGGRARNATAAVDLVGSTSQKMIGDAAAKLKAGIALYAFQGSRTSGGGGSSGGPDVAGDFLAAYKDLARDPRMAGAALDSRLAMAGIGTSGDSNALRVAIAESDARMDAETDARMDAENAENAEKVAAAKRRQGKSDRLGEVFGYTSNLKDTAQDLFGSVGEGAMAAAAGVETLGSAFQGLTDGVTAAFDAWIMGEETAGSAFKRITAESMKSMATIAAKKAMMETAEGIASLFVNPPAAASHFAAAGVFAGVAAATGAAAHEAYGAGWAGQGAAGAPAATSYAGGGVGQSSGPVTYVVNISGVISGDKEALGEYVADAVKKAHAQGRAVTGDSAAEWD